jgi:plastocyanin
MPKGMTGGLVALAAGLLMAGCGGGSSYSSTPTTMPTVAPNPPGAAADVTITINGIDGGMSFAPNPASVKAGQTVAWKNNDSTTHTATQDGGGGFDTGAIPSGATSAPVTISAAGTLNYHCSYHPSMVGSLTVASTTGGGY